MEPVTIPDAVRATVLGRIRAMDRVERDIVLRASVIGRRFDVRLLAAMSRHPEPRVREALAHARDLQLVEDEPDADAFVFRHAVTRDVIYEELLHGRVRALHRRIARVLEDDLAGGDAQLNDLAYHAWAAGDVRRGVRYNELAGDRAAEIHAGDDAHAFYTRARALLAIDSDAYARLTLKLAAVAHAPA